jgi:hypothetical protein
MADGGTGSRTFKEPEATPPGRGKSEEEEEEEK